MCEKCVELVNQYYPDLSEEEQGHLLMSATCFPFGDPEDVERQLKELKEKTDGTLHGAIAFVADEMDAAIAQGRIDARTREVDIMRKMAMLLTRYRRETPIGNQPHMICEEIDETLEQFKEWNEQQDS